MTSGDEMADDLDSGSGESRETTVRRMARAYLSALLAADEVAAESTIRDAIDAGLTGAEIDEELIAPALWRVGELWERGDISVADEHAATEISLRVLALQREARRVADARAGHRVMLATPPGEMHVVALRMVSNLLRHSGYQVLMLGADVPADDLRTSVLHHRPDVICMSVTLVSRADPMLRLIDAMRELHPSVGFVVGGRGMTIERQLQPGVQLCPRVSQAVEAVDATVKKARLN